MPAPSARRWTVFLSQLSAALRGVSMTCAPVRHLGDPLRHRQRDQGAGEADDGGEDEQRAEIELGAVLRQDLLDAQHVEHDVDHRENGDVGGNEQGNAFHLALRSSIDSGLAVDMVSSPGDLKRSAGRLLLKSLQDSWPSPRPPGTCPQITSGLLSSRPCATPSHGLATPGCGSSFACRSACKWRWAARWGVSPTRSCAHGAASRRATSIRVLPDLTPAARAQILAQHFEALGLSIVEMAMGWFGDARAVRERVDVEGAEHLAAGLAKGKGVILFAAHYTTFEFFWPALRPLCTKLCGMYKWQRNPVMNRIMNLGRGRYYDTMFAKDNVREMIRCLRDNAVVWYASDQSYGGKGSVLLPFFDEPAMTNTAIGRIARASGAVVLPYFCRRLESERYVMSIGAPVAGVPSGDEVADTRVLTKQIENYIRLVPRAILVDSPAFQGPTGTASRSVCCADALSLSEQIEALEISERPIPRAFLGATLLANLGAARLHACYGQDAALVATAHRPRAGPPAAAGQTPRRTNGANQPRVVLPRIERRRPAAIARPALRGGRHVVRRDGPRLVRAHREVARARCRARPRAPRSRAGAGPRRAAVWRALHDNRARLRRIGEAARRG